MSMNNDERLFMMMATIEQLVEQTKQQQAVITAQSEQISQLANTVEKQLETIKDLKNENLKSAKELETAVLRGVTNTVHQSLGLPLEQQVRRGVDRGIHAGISDLQNDASRVTFDYIKLLKDSSEVINNATSKIQETLGLKTMSIIGGSLILSFLLLFLLIMAFTLWFTPSLEEIKERRAELALVERETGADFKRCDGVACVKVLIEQCNYGQSSIGDKTAYCRLPNSWQRSMGK